MVTWIFLPFSCTVLMFVLYNSVYMQMQGAKNASFTTCHSGKL